MKNFSPIDAIRAKYEEDLPAGVTPASKARVTAYMRSLSSSGITYWQEQLRFGFVGRLHEVLCEDSYEKYPPFDPEDMTIPLEEETLQ